MKWPFWIFLALYLFALALFAISAFGLFGQERDPLGGVFLIPLGLPWNIVADKFGLAGPASALIAPLVNLSILYAVWKYFGALPAKGAP